MADIKLFKIDQGSVTELAGESAGVEKSLQKQIEEHMLDYLGVHLLASECSTGKVHGGRIDSLGLDQSGCPVIIEYKRTQNSNVINQGLFYLDWLLDHRGDFVALVSEKLGADALASIDWSNPRLICIAGSFTKYDEHAVQLIARNIELVRYRRYGTSFLLLELVNQTVANPLKIPADDSTNKTRKYTTFDECLADGSPQIQKRFEAVREFALGLGEEVWMKRRKYGVDFRKGKDWVNFALVQIGHDGVLVVSDLNDQEIRLESDQDLESAKRLIVHSYGQV